MSEHTERWFRKQKAQLALNMARDVKGIRNGFSRYLGDKKKARDT